MIRGYFDPDSPYPVPKARAALSIPSHPQPVSIDFLLDTGAAASSLFPRDAAKLGIDPRAVGGRPDMTRSVELAGVGGLVTFYEIPCTYVFRHEDGELQKIDHDILLSPPAPVYWRFPSILGWDILSGFEVVANWKIGRVTLSPNA